LGTKLTSSIRTIVAVFQVRDIEFRLAVDERVGVLQIIGGGQQVRMRP
jgi:hypothetical protein